MKGLTCSRETSTPLMSPTMAETASTTITATNIISGLPCMMNDASTAATLIKFATERSMDPARMTKVCPIATIPSATIRCRRPTTPSTASILVCPVEIATPM